jgi:CRISPR-associated protein Cas1
MPRFPVHNQPHGNADYLPIRMINEVVYCPRLFHLEHVQGLFLNDKNTIAGQSQHEKTAKRSAVRKKKSADAAAETTETEEDTIDPPGTKFRTLDLSSPAWGVAGKIDLIEVDDQEVIVVEYKHGSLPLQEVHHWQEHKLPYRAWPADVVQVGLYMAVLRENGLPCERARIYYRQSKQSTFVPWSSNLEYFLRDALAQAREVAACESPPEPLRDSPKCPGCSLISICLPDEHYALKAEEAAQLAANEPPAPEPRRIIPGRDDQSVVYVFTPGSVVRKDGDAIVVEPRNSEPTRVLCKDLSHVALFGPSTITHPCQMHLLESGVMISHHTMSGRLLGTTAPLLTRNIAMRRAQFAAAEDRARLTEIARAFVVAKIRNQRTVLKRYRKGLAHEAMGGSQAELPEWAGGTDTLTQENENRTAHAVNTAIERMQIALRGAERADDVDAIRGYEGEAAAHYFSAIPEILPQGWENDFCGRTRRPPRDRINAMLSFGYALLTRDAVSALACVGLDPMLGYLHTMIAGRPALALDLMEPFRPSWVDTAVLRLLATGGIAREDFHLSSLGVTMSDAGKKALVTAYERRADELTTHPRFGYRMSYRRLLELEARVLGKYLLREVEHFTPLWTR